MHSQPEIPDPHRIDREVEDFRRQMQKQDGSPFPTAIRFALWLSIPQRAVTNGNLLAVAAGAGAAGIILGLLIAGNVNSLRGIG